MALGLCVVLVACGSDPAPYKGVPLPTPTPISTTPDPLGSVAPSTAAVPQAGASGSGASAGAKASAKKSSGTAQAGHTTSANTAAGAATPTPQPANTNSQVGRAQATTACQTWKHGTALSGNEKLSTFSSAAQQAQQASVLNTYWRNLAMAMITATISAALPAGAPTPAAAGPNVIQQTCGTLGVDL